MGSFWTSGCILKSTSDTPGGDGEENIAAVRVFTEERPDMDSFISTYSTNVEPGVKVDEQESW